MRAGQLYVVDMKNPFNRGYPAYSCDVAESLQACDGLPEPGGFTMPYTEEHFLRHAAGPRYYYITPCTTGLRRP
jgi:hypothetical protein